MNEPSRKWGSRPLRVLVVEQGNGFGGALTSLAALFQGMEGRGVRYELLTSYPQEFFRPQGVLDAVGVLPRNRVYGPNARLEKAMRLVAGNRGGNIAYLADALGPGRVCARAIARYVQEHRIDIVHANNGTLINDAAIRGAHIAGVPCVVHVRGPEFPSRVSAFLAKRVARYLPVSRYVADTVAALGVESERMDIVPEGLDVRTFTASAKGATVRGELGLPPETFVVGMFGSLMPWKGQLEFLEAFSLALRQAPDMKALLVGGSPPGCESYKDAVLHCMRANGLRDSACLLGHRSDVPSVMAACNLVVHGSISPEPFGRVVLEGMALGRPVIATDAGGPREFVRHGVNGLLTAPKDPESMAGAILDIRNAPDRGAALGKAARETVAGEFSAARHAELVENSYISSATRLLSR